MATPLVRAPVSRGYVPTVFGNRWLDWSQDNWFTLSDVERMRRDPQVQMGLRILRAPLAGVKWKIKAADQEVGKFVASQVRRFWRTSLLKCLRMFEYGFAAGEVSYTLRDNKIHFADLLDFHPYDARPLEFTDGTRAGRFAGLRVRLGGGRGRRSSDVDIGPRHAFWIANEPEYGALYGRPRLAGAFLPYQEKRGRKGAIDARRLWYVKNAYHSGVMRHPFGEVTLEDGTLMSYQDLARQILEKFETGGVLVLPNDRDDAGNYLWEYEPPKTHGDLKDVRDYPKDLDQEILKGLGIPPELVDAATVGSGYSGRAIPAQWFFTSLDETVAHVLQTFERLILHGLVRLNYGPARYELAAESLAELVAREPGDAGKGEEEEGPVQLSYAAADRKVLRLPVATVAGRMRSQRPSRAHRDDTTLIQLSQLRAPKGGVTIRGVDYVGGEFIPAEVAKTLTPEEKAKVDGDGDGKPDGASALAQLTKTLLASLPASAKSALTDYRAGGSDDLNAELRAGREPIDRDMKGMMAGVDAAMAKAKPLAEPVRTYRGLAFKDETQAAEMMAKYESAITSGESITDPAYVSTSLDAGKAAEFASGHGKGKTGFVLEVINARHGIYMEGVGGSQHSGEQEFLLPRGTKFKVVGKKTTQHNGKDVVAYQLEQVIGGERVQLSQARAPKGGVTIRGVDYPGGKFIPTEIAETLTPEEKAKLDGDGDGAADGQTQSPDVDLDALAAKLPESERTGATWEKVKKIATNVGVRVFNVLNTLGAKATILAPEIADTADDWIHLKMAKEYDPVLAATGIGANTVMVVASHVFSRALNKLGIRLSQDGPTMDELTAHVASLINAVYEGAGLPVPTLDAAEIQAMLRERLSKRARPPAEA